MDKLKVLVLGDGLLGSEIVKQTGWDYISRKNNNFDINNLRISIPKDKYQNPIHDVIINCVANTDTYSNDKDSHWNVNYKMVDELIIFCNDYNIKLVHISTDYLYAGSINEASENDVPVHCNTWYGYTKLLADGLVQLKTKDYLICRCTHKPNPFPYDNGWIDQIGNFDYVDNITSLIILMIDKNLSGVYNVGNGVKTMYELASETNDNVRVSFAPPHVPKNLSMNTNKLWSQI